MSIDQNTKKLSNDVGFLLFNHQSSLNYNRIAEICISRIKKFFPNTAIAVCGDHVNEADYNIELTPPKNSRLYDSEQIDWHNLGRCQSYDLTPFETTIVIDTDVILNSTQLQLIFDSRYSLLMHKKIYSLSKNKCEIWKVGKSDIDMYFATILKFTKNNDTKIFFDCWKNILSNYNYYAGLYHFPNTVKRNDFAVSLALRQVMDFGDDAHCEIPWPLFTGVDDVSVKSIEPTSIILQDQHSEMIVKNDVHVLNKKSLATC